MQRVKNLIAVFLLVALAATASVASKIDGESTIEARQAIEKDSTLQDATNNLCLKLGAEVCQYLKNTSCADSPAQNFCLQRMALELIASAERCGKKRNSSQCADENSAAFSSFLSFSGEKLKSEDSFAKLAFMACEPFHRYVLKNKLAIDVQNLLKTHSPGMEQTYEYKDLMACIKENYAKMVTTQR